MQKKTGQGTGKGTSVLELIKAFEDANGIEVPYEIVDRRPGDIASCYADASKAKRERTVPKNMDKKLQIML